MGDRLLTPEQVAERLQVKERTVYEWLRRGLLRGIKLGRLWRVRETDLEAMVLGEDERSLFLEDRATARGSPDGGRSKPREHRTWLENSAAEMARQLEELEADIPPEELKAWKEAFAQAARPVRYVPGKGFIEVEMRP